MLKNQWVNKPAELWKISWSVLLHVSFVFDILMTFYIYYLAYSFFNNTEH